METIRVIGQFTMQLVGYRYDDGPVAYLRITQFGTHRIERLHCNEWFSTGGVFVKLSAIYGTTARIAINAPSSVKVLRGELDVRTR